MGRGDRLHTALGLALESRLDAGRPNAVANGLGAKGGDLVVSAQLIGAAPRRITIMARPAWDAAAGAVRLTDVAFVFDAEDPNQGLAVDLFYERIRTALDRAANDLLQARHGADARRTPGGARPRPGAGPPGRG
jgi:hypothetical protein